jgi:hypothetical protein
MEGVRESRRRRERYERYMKEWEENEELDEGMGRRRAKVREKKRSDRRIMKVLKEGKRWSWRRKGRKDEGRWIEWKGYERQKRKITEN